MAVALSLAVWISHRERSSDSGLGLSAPAARNAHQEAVVQPKANDLAQSTDQTIGKPVLKGFLRVRVGPNEVDEIAEDVTIRYFETTPVKSKLRRTMKEKKFGEDVTVRYFADGPITVSQPAAVFETVSPQQTSLRAR
jgi:hypothetical protein